MLNKIDKIILNLISRVRIILYYNDPAFSVHKYKKNKILFHKWRKSRNFWIFLFFLIIILFLFFFKNIKLFDFYSIVSGIVNFGFLCFILMIFLKILKHKKFIDEILSNSYYWFFLILILLILLFYNKEKIFLYLKTENDIDTFKFLGLLFAALIGLWQLFLVNKRSEQHEKNLQISIKNTDIQFNNSLVQNLKDAVELLAKDKTSNHLGAIYGLHNLAQETFDNKENIYTKNVFDILCSYICEKTNEVDYLNNYVKINNPKPSLDIQTIIVLLFKSNFYISQPNSSILFIADLNNAKLVGADLKSARLYRANLENANLNGANLTNANLRYTNLTNANFTRANLNGVILNSANLKNAVFEHAKFIMADLESQDFKNADLSNTDFTDANLKKTILNNAKLSGMITTDADFEGSDLV